jgi:predicted nucleic acid-binding Zn ribbon protein
MNNIPFHLYECAECVLLFAVEQAFEDQSSICCPNCGEEKINDVAAGEMILRGERNGQKDA